MNELDNIIGEIEQDEKQKKRTQREIRERRERIFARTVLIGGMLLIGGSFFMGTSALLHHFIKKDAIEAVADDSVNTVRKYSNKGFDIKGKKVMDEPDIDVQLLTPNEYSRPQLTTEKIKNIVVHYTANPGTTAQQNRDYFESLSQTHSASVSSHFVIGIDGEIIQCIPTSERAYASNDRNIDTISIECCHLDKSGEFTRKTYASLVQLCAWLCGQFDLQPTDIIRHYDVTGKICPKYFVDREDKWEEFKIDVMKYIQQNGVTEDK